MCHNIFMKRNKRSVAVGVSVWFLLLLLVVMYSPITLRIAAAHPTYANILKEAEIEGDTKVIDIAMLGAHDAFSHKINLFSSVDPAEEGIVTSKPVNAVFKGGLVRVLKAQQASAKTLLNRGVRYFDVRISNYKGEWYTKHGLIDTKLKYYVGDIYNFLKDKPKEFIIFDIQHIYLGDKSMNNFMNYFSNITLMKENLVLDDFLNHSSTTPLSDLEYFDVTGGTRGGIILLLNDDATAAANHGRKFYERGNGESEVKAIRSKWHNRQEVKDIINDINTEANYLKEEAIKPYFRVNQAQLTPDYMKRPLGTLWNWSLLNLAAKSNKVLLNQPNFKNWLNEMPIFMVDFANTNSGNFNTKINKIILEYNKSL